MPPRLSLLSDNQPKTLSLLPATERATNTASRQPDTHADKLYAHLRTGDTLALYKWIVLPESKQDSRAAAREEHHGMAAKLPSLMFSEMLRCLDPFVVREKRDYAKDIPILPGMTQFTPLRDQVDDFGIRLVFASLLRELLSICMLRYQDGQPDLLQHDFVVLFRCAGAASDIRAAKRIWIDMRNAGHADWEKSDMHTEFVRARFLTEALYAQGDPLRLRVRPLNLHWQKLELSPKRVFRLDRLRLALEKNKMERFGQNLEQPGYIEHLTRILRKTKPVRKQLFKGMAYGTARNEQFLATILVAMSRTGSVRVLSYMLQHFWEVSVAWDKKTGKYSVSGGAEFPVGSSMRPTAVLLDAVVQAYCCVGHVACALHTVRFLSQRYNVDIPRQTWFDLLSWTYMMTSKPAKTEWMAAGFSGRVLQPISTQMMWLAMTSAPYNVQPGFTQYNLLIKALIQRRKLDDALHLMRQAREMYETQLREYEEALMEFAETARQGVRRGEAARRVQQVACQKWYMWYCMQTWCWQILKKARPHSIHDPLAVQIIPNIVDEFRPFIPQNAQYRIATGLVRLHEPNHHPKHIVTRQIVDLPALRPYIREKYPSEDAGELVDKLPRTPLERGLVRQQKRWVRRALRWQPDLRKLGAKTPRQIGRAHV